MTQADLASKAGISRTALSALENGFVGRVSFRKVCRVLEALKLELEVHPRPKRKLWTVEELLE
ncbi:helix-turn-helix domain-containing protein [Thermosulfurimonas sp. F29]|uniref:helix-turn-helix domain-containing protein n=1 Tax=Thermosulfurimonas sp. F29 TaxID=2867247 RepID=UPI002103E65B|nr:helix-turn-helix domain-containing protein [Thermosulfurimonas sp. F29]